MLHKTLQSLIKVLVLTTFGHLHTIFFQCSFLGQEFTQCISNDQGHKIQNKFSDLLFFCYYSRFPDIPSAKGQTFKYTYSWNPCNPYSVSDVGDCKDVAVSVLYADHQLIREFTAIFFIEGLRGTLS